MYNNPKAHLPWSPASMLLYHQQAARRDETTHEQQLSSRFNGGPFSIRSILSETRPEMSCTDSRYLGGVTYSQPQMVCCNEGSPFHLQNPASNSTQTPQRTMVTFESTKLQGCLGNAPISKVRQRKGNKRSRTIFTPYQLQRLEKAFERQQYVAGEERRQLAISLSLTETQVKVWFQNRRIRYRKQRIIKPSTAT